MTGYTPDEKLRFEQLIKLRRQWLKDQELSPREPVVQAKPPGPVAKFWASFLEPKSLWRLYVSTANSSYMLAKQSKQRTKKNNLFKVGNIKGVYIRNKDARTFFQLIFWVTKNKVKIVSLCAKN